MYAPNVMVLKLAPVTEQLGTSRTIPYGTVESHSLLTGIVKGVFVNGILWSQSGLTRFGKELN